MGDVEILKQIPGFKGFPTTLVVDRAGNVRVIIIENTKGTIEGLADVVRVLLAEPVSKPDAPAKKP
jgi:hypothetical protein